MRFLYLSFLLFLSVLSFVYGIENEKYLSILLILWAFLVLNNILYLSQILQKTGLGMTRRNRPLAFMVLNSLSQEKITRISIRGLRNFNMIFVAWALLALAYLWHVFWSYTALPQIDAAQKLLQNLDMFFGDISNKDIIYSYEPFIAALKQSLILALPGLAFISTLSASMRSSQQEMVLGLSVLCFLMSLIIAFQSFMIPPEIWPFYIADQGIGASSSLLLDQTALKIAPSYVETDFKARLFLFGPVSLVIGFAMLVMPFLVCLIGLLKSRLSILNFGLCVLVVICLGCVDLMTGAQSSNMAAWISGYVILGLLWTKVQHSGQRVYRMHLS